MEAAEKKFWEQLASVGKEVLDQGRRMGFGMSLVEVKFQNGAPAVLIRSISVNTKYPDDAQAKAAIGKELETAATTEFDGSRTYTVVFNHGKIQRVLLDEYSSHLLR